MHTIARSGYSENHDISSNNQPSDFRGKRYTHGGGLRQYGPQFVSEEFEAFLRLWYNPL